MATFNCRAIAVFTEYVSGFGMVHGDPANKQAKTVALPESAVQGFIDRGFIAAPRGFEADAPADGGPPAE